MSRQIVLIPVDRQDDRIHDIFCLSRSDRSNYEWLRSYVRNTYNDCRVITTTTDRLSELKTTCVPYVGTYLLEEMAQ
jgi:hypothetical protein